MALSQGDKAPDFTLVSKGADGPELVSLSDLTSKGKVVLLFIPMAFTGVCTEQLCAASNDTDAYKDLNATVVGISGDGPFAQEAWAQKENITIPLLSDYEHKVAEAYGIAYESFLPEANLTMGGVAKRSAFVVDTDGTILYAEVQDHPKDLPDVESIKAALK